KRAPPPPQAPPPQKEGMLNAPTRRSEPLRSKVDGASEPSSGLFLTQQGCESLTAGASEPSSEWLTAGASEGLAEVMFGGG
uniref:hypothetical protein n=1 Tax=Prevotella sp. TaxID=59823 RepID=UPI0025CC2295